MKFDWTPDLVEKILAMNAAGDSAGIIAREIGTTRNAVIGKLMRVKIQLGTYAPTGPREPILERIESRRAGISPELLRNTTPKRPQNPRRCLPKVPTTGIGFRLPALKLIPKPVRTSTVGLLDATGCLWAVGHDPRVIGGHTFCNHPKRDGSSYCEEHARDNVADYSRELIRSTIKGAIKAYKPRAA